MITSNVQIEGLRAFAQSLSTDGLELELERLDGIFPIPSIEKPYLNVRHLRPIVVEATDIDAINFRRGAWIAKWMNAADLTEPVLGNLVPRLIQRE